MENITQKQLSERWRLTPSTLRRWRVKGFGPPSKNEGKKVIYNIIDVMCFEKNKIIGDDFTSHKDLAKRFGINIKTLYRWAKEKPSLKQYKLEKKIFYKNDEIHIYEQECNIHKKNNLEQNEGVKNV